MAFSECTSVSNNGISEPSVFLERGGIGLLLAAAVIRILCLRVQTFEWLVCSWMRVHESLKGLKFHEA